MQVIIPKSALEAKRSCGSHTNNPFWNAQSEELVFPDWDAAVAWYLSDEAPNGVQRLKWLVRRELVPMTRDSLRQTLLRAGVEPALAKAGLSPTVREMNGARR